MAATPRVLQLVHSLNPGGTERLVVELASRLNDDVPMAVCCLDDVGAWGRELRVRNIEVNALERKPGFRPGLGRAVAAAARKHGATVIHAHHYSPFVYACLARAFGPELRVVYTEHGRLSDAPPSPKRRMANSALRTMPRGVFAVSQNLKSHMVAEGFAADDVRVIYNGVGIGRCPNAEDKRRVRRELGIDDTTVVIGTVARLDPVKDLGTLISATAQLVTSSPVVTLIVGDGPERAALEAHARKSGVGASIRFLGHRDDARQILEACDVYVNCSISEGVSLTILEAMAACLPIVATRVGGTPEVVDEQSGRLVAARDPAALATALSEFVGNPARRVQAGATARRRVEASFTIDRMVGEYRDVYARAV